MTLSLEASAAVWSPARSDRASGGAPDGTGTAAPLLLLMHGYGSHEHDLVGLVPHLPRALRSVAVRAPLTAGPGYAWVPIVDPGRPDPTATQDAADAVLAWLDEHVPETTPVALLGFSQGGLMVTHLLRSRPARFFAGVVLSGFTADVELPGDDVLAQIAPPVFFGRGDVDPVITPEAFARTSAWLPEHTTLTEVVYPGLAHGISQQELVDVDRFLAGVLPG